MLGKARDENEIVKAANDRAKHLLELTYGNEEVALDVPFSMDELESAIRKLKPNREADLSSITSEHLKYGGHTLKVWLLKIFNAIIQQEAIPHTLNIAAISPVYKGGGKDPLDRGSYRGISVTPVLSKLLEMLILGRLLPLFEDLNIPNINQTGHRKHVSCTDAIFTTTEVLSHYLHESETTYLCC